MSDPPASGAGCTLLKMGCNWPRYEINERVTCTRVHVMTSLVVFLLEPMYLSLPGCLEWSLFRPSKFRGPLFVPAVKDKSLGKGDVNNNYFVFVPSGLCIP